MVEPDMLMSTLYLLIFVACLSGVLGVAGAIAEWLDRRRNRRLK